MGEAAVAVARTAGYRNAGTVEFLVEGNGDSARFYFLEMNTRLQVEHPVTEQVTGVDLVRAQIGVAAGEPICHGRRRICRSAGMRSRLRVYAEDPARQDLPQAGPLLLYREPSMPGIRIDAGVTEGSEVAVHYDPLLAKLIASGETRDAARRASARRHPQLSRSSASAPTSRCSSSCSSIRSSSPATSTRDFSMPKAMPSGRACRRVPLQRSLPWPPPPAPRDQPPRLAAAPRARPTSIRGRRSGARVSSSDDRNRRGPARERPLSGHSRDEANDRICRRRARDVGVPRRPHLHRQRHA